MVEDEPLVAMLLVDLLDELGCTVAAQACSVAEGLDRANDTLFDAAILDVNLRGQPVWPLADALQAKGIRFVLATGYDGRSPSVSWRSIGGWSNDIMPFQAYSRSGLKSHTCWRQAPANKVIANAVEPSF